MSDKPLGKGLAELLPAEMLEKMQEPENAEMLKEWADVTLKHHGNPLYLQATEYWRRTQVAQISKGARKYQEPLNPDSWTFGQLVDHAMQENVDQAHYLTALLQKGNEIAEKVNRYDFVIHVIRQCIGILGDETCDEVKTVKRMLKGVL